MTYFTDYLIAFFACVFALIFIAAFVTFRSSGISLKNFINSKTGKGAIASAGLAIVSIAITSLVIFLFPNNANANPFKDGSWFNDAGVYIGVDYTRKISPQCEPDGVDSRGTSNLGAWFNIWQDKTGTLRINSNYTHHSCYLGEDRNGYDGLGVQVEWKLWRRK